MSAAPTVRSAGFKATSLPVASVLAAEAYSRGVDPDDVIEIVPGDDPGFTHFVSKDHGPDFASRFDSLMLPVSAFLRGNRWAVAKAKQGPPAPAAGGIPAELRAALEKAADACARARSHVTVGVAISDAAQAALKHIGVPIGDISDAFISMLTAAGVGHGAKERTAELVDLLAISRAVLQEKQRTAEDGGSR